MRIVLKHIINNVIEKKSRSIAVVFFLVLLSFVMYIILSIPSVIRGQYEHIYREIYGDIDIAVFQKNATPYQVDEIDLSDCEFKRLITIEKSTYMQKDSKYKAIYIVGANPKDAVKMRFIREKGVYELKKNEAVISEKTAREFNVSVGDHLSIITSSMEVISLTIEKVIPSEGYFSIEHDSNFIFVTYETAESIFDLEGKVSYTYLKLETKELSKIADELQQKNSSFFVYQIVDEDVINQSVNNMLYLFILVFLLLFTMLFFALATLNRSVLKDRIKAMAIFKSLGASSSTVSMFLEMEFMLYGLFGGILGSLIGGSLIKYIPNLFENSTVETKIQGGLQMRTAVLVVVISIAIQLIMSMGAIRTVTKKAFLELMKQKKSVLKDYAIQMIGGSVLISVGVLLYYFYSLKESFVFVIVMLCLLFGFSLIIPFMFYLLTTLLERNLKCFSNSLFSLSLVNIRTKSLMATHVRLITANMILLILLATFSVSFISYFDRFGDNVKADYMVSYVSQTKSTYEELNKLDGIKDSSLVFLDEAILKQENQSTHITLCSNYMYEKRREFFCGYEVFDNVSLDLKSNEIILDEHIMKLYGISIGDMIILQVGRGSNQELIDFCVVGTCDGAGITLSRFVGVISQEVFEAMFGDTPRYVLINSKGPEITVEDIKSALPDALAVIETRDEFVDEQLKIPRTFVKVITMVLVFGFIACLLGLLYNQKNLLEEEERDYAIYYTTCMSKKMIFQMVMIQEGMISIFVVLFSFAGSIVLYQLLSKLLESMYLCFPMHFYAGKTMIIVCSILSFLFVFIATITGVKINKANYVNIIKKDSKI